MKEKCKYDNLLIVRRFLFSTLIVLCMTILFSCSKKTETKNTAATDTVMYYCPMHPEIVQDHPGKCPKPECKGMDLVIKTSDAVLGNVLRPVNSSVLSSIATTKPVFRKMPIDVDADGYINYDQRAKNSISSLVSGRIEKLYVKYNYQPVKKGQIVFDIYSPELVNAQDNLIYILNSDPDDVSLINAAKQKLIQLGFSDNMTDELVNTKKTRRIVPVYSNYNGFVYDSKPMNPGKVKAGDMSAAKNANYESGSQLSVKEGQYVMMGETVFNIADNENLVVEFQVKPEDMNKIQKGQDIEVIMETGKNINAKIDFIEPVLQSGKKTMTCRSYITNSNNEYAIGSLAKVKIKGEEFETLWLPATAVVDLGKEKIVWLKYNMTFVAKKVETGIHSGDMIEIADGLTASDEVALEAHYLTDSEGFIKENKNEE